MRTTRTLFGFVASFSIVGLSLAHANAEPKPTGHPNAGGQPPKIQVDLSKPNVSSPLARELVRDRFAHVGAPGGVKPVPTPAPAPPSTPKITAITTEGPIACGSKPTFRVTVQGAAKDQTMTLRIGKYDSTIVRAPYGTTPKDVTFDYDWQEKNALVVVKGGESQTFELTMPFAVSCPAGKNENGYAVWLPSSYWIGMAPEGQTTSYGASIFVSHGSPYTYTVQL